MSRLVSVDSAIRAHMEDAITRLFANDVAAGRLVDNGDGTYSRGPNYDPARLGDLA